MPGRLKHTVLNQHGYGVHALLFMMVVGHAASIATCIYHRPGSQNYDSELLMMHNLRVV